MSQFLQPQPRPADPFSKESPVRWFSLLLGRIMRYNCPSQASVQHQCHSIISLPKDNLSISYTPARTVAIAPENVMKRA